ncbi:MAG: xanthine dehydrogenase family protein molybdopterin-binding subunit [Chloroflexi bacterium]|nr:molybdopterin-dependent oxidoreductase [Dehalococcoidia bacterium]PKB81581.1 MAG: carbon monoxide dehydrogenase [SAR202 cluster bacterium MP-SInd-SRR3963457-G1]RUA28721.1 MAG: xanthine dehydrogenase family protein molybdopterin-binding subunit [Chloroflexota bacterium]
MTTRIFGSGIRRREDPRLITGGATFTDDVQLPGMVHAAILRSPHAHAKINSIDAAAASEAPGVVAVYTGADTDGVLNPIPCAWLPPDCDIKAVAHPAIAKDVVRYQGDAVAVVVAETRYQAEDALELINVDYEVLPSVVSPEAAMQPGAPQIHEDAPNNQAFHWIAAGGDTDAAFADADVIVKDTILQQRLIPNAMEPRSAVANWTRSMGELTLWSTSQNPHIVRFLGSLVTGIPEHKIRVIATEVGGGFGSKIPMYADEMIASFCSMQLNRPVKWTATRSEGFLATIHGRDHIEHVEMAATREGKITAIRTVVYAGMGAYLSTAAPGVPTILHGLIYSGPYDIGATRADIYGVFSNTTPVDAYRGAGRPEATFLIERLIDLLAVELGTDPVELRRKNLIPKFEDGHDVASGITYDSGDYEPLLNMVLGHVDYQALRQEQARMRERGAYMGIGVTCYAEICGLGPSQVAGAVGFGGGLWESAIVRFHPTGKVNAYIGTAPHGQGEETTFAQILADELGVDVDDVGIIHGDTSNTPMGWGTYGSRTTVVGGAALALAARKVKEKARLLAAHLLEAAEADVEYEDGKFFVKGSPDQSKTIQEMATMANVAWNLPEGMEPGLEASAFYDPPNFVYPFGTHVAVVEVDKDNGNVVIKRYVAGDDCGPQINPMIVEGQIHGGVVQGWGQALWEGVVYDDNGQLLTGSMTDYALPRAHMFPDMEILSTVTPSPHNPLGVKGIGETGAIASTVTVYNAVIDALRPLGVTGIDMPLTPEKVWQAIRQGQGS